MIKLKTRSISVLTDDEVKLVSGGSRTDLNHSVDGCDGSWFCTSNECPSNFCMSDGCDSFFCVSEGHCDTNACNSFDCDTSMDCPGTEPTYTMSCQDP